MPFYGTSSSIAEGNYFSAIFLPRGPCFVSGCVELLIDSPFSIFQFHISHGFRKASSHEHAKTGLTASRISPPVVPCYGWRILRWRPATNQFERGACPPQHDGVAKAGAFTEGRRLTYPERSRGNPAENERCQVPLPLAPPHPRDGPRAQPRGPRPMGLMVRPRFIPPAPGPPPQLCGGRRKG
jgi:hypothetical protein